MKSSIYGETPLAVWAKIVRLASITPDDVFFDLGCGRGKLCFWTASWIGCKTVGVDLAAPFIRRGTVLAKLLSFRSLSFVKESIANISLDRATVIYLYTFCPEEESLDFSCLPLKSRVISVSSPLSSKHLTVIASTPATFPWGDAEVFIHRRS